MSARVWRVGLAAFTLLAAATAQAPAMGREPKTVENLKSAYVGETTARAKYRAFARQAEREGYPAAAALFRAASRAERIHARNHRKALEALGAPLPMPGEYTATPGSTRENLQDAIRGESYERDTMYPAMLRTAELENQSEALRSFTYAREAEAQHASLYRLALSRLDRTGTPATYWVCPECGATTTYLPLRCPACGTRQAKFIRFRGGKELA